MTKKVEIKEKEIDAPYELPEGWKWVRLEDVCEEILYGVSESAKEFGKYKLLRITDIQDNSVDWNLVPFTDYDEEKAKKYFLKENDIVFARTGATVGKSYLIKKLNCSAIYASYLIRVRMKLSETSSYIKRFFESPFYWYQIMDNAVGIGQPNCNGTVLKNLRIPIPPTIAEQQRIVNRIESMFAKLDEAKEKAQNVVDSFETRKAAILHQAFTGNLTAKWRKENGVSDDSWEEKSIGNCGSVFGGGTPSTSHKEYWENGNIPWITSKDMKSDLIEDSELHVNMNGIDNSSAKYIDKPAVLFVMRSGILRRTFPVCMVKKEFTVNQDLKALVPNDSVILEYLFYACKSNERKILDTCMKSGTTVESINSDSLFNFLIKIPSLTEQQEIVRILDTVLEKERTAKFAAEQVLEQIDLLKKSILARAFRGEL